MLVLLCAVVALLLPELFSHVKPTVINPLLGVIMFGMGMTLRVEDFRIVFSRPKDVIVGCVAQFTVMPFLAWLLARAFSLDEALTVGVVIVGVVMLHNLCGLGLGYTVGRLLGMSTAKRRAVAIEVGMQNSGLASSLATLHFAAYPMATIPGAIFSVWHNLSGAAIARLFNKT